jgi:lipoprotein-anchoring transpeptidase ErfK/SrfK
MIQSANYSMDRFYILAVIIFAFSLSSCQKKKEEFPKVESPVIVKKDTIAKQLPKNNKEENKPDTGIYKTFYLDGAKSLSSLSSELGPEKMLLVFKLNRRDLRHLKQGDSIVLPNKGDSELTYSPFPLQIPELDSLKKILFVSRKIQAFAAYEKGILVKWGPTSTGKKTTPTPEKLYHTNWKSLETHSTVDEAWILKWYFNLDNLEGISLHEYELPGYPASHSCVRLLASDAEWIYHWADQWKLSPERKFVAENGTPVIVFGNYSYGKIPLWKKLQRDPHVTDVTEKEIIDVKEKFLPGKKLNSK